MILKSLAIAVALIWSLLMSNILCASSLPVAASLKSDSTAVKKHLIVLVHGVYGNDKEMGYLQEALEREASSSENLIVYSATSNVGKTTDGIAAGGKRLAAEVLHKIESHQTEQFTLTMVGNSLGGLYARYAISELLPHSKIEPKTFCTTATPHLGVSHHTYIPVPKWAEWVIGSTMRTTGRDLFLQSTIVHELATKETFLAPLRRFQYRLAYANAYGTDFQVPTSTAAFLARADTPHFTIDQPRKGSIILRVKTNETNSITGSNVQTTSKNDVQTENNKEYGNTEISTGMPRMANDAEMAASLDSLGWTKVFCDVREDLPLPSLWNPFASTDATLMKQPVWTSEELLQSVGKRLTERFHVPMGHSVMVANSKSEWYGNFNAKGRPIMDQLAKELIEVLEFDLHEGSCSAKQREHLDERK